MPALVMPLISLDSGMVLETLEKFAWSHGGCRKKENSFSVKINNRPLKTFVFDKTPKDAKELPKRLKIFRSCSSLLFFQFQKGPS